MNENLSELEGIDLFDLTVTDVGEEAAAFAINEEGAGGSCCCSEGPWQPGGK